MDTKTFKKIIAAIPDDAEILIETKVDQEWSPLKSVQIRESPDDENKISVYINFSD